MHFPHNACAAQQTSRRTSSEPALKWQQQIETWGCGEGLFLVSTCAGVPVIKDAKRKSTLVFFFFFFK